MSDANLAVSIRSADPMTNIRSGHMKQERGKESDTATSGERDTSAFAGYAAELPPMDATRCANMLKSLVI